MKIVNYLQGSESWLAWRKSGIGASDIPIIMETNPYSTPIKLWEEKCGFSEEKVLSEAMKHGVKNEITARNWINENYPFKIKSLCIEDDENSFMKASLDGWDEDKKILVEIKCPVSVESINRTRMENYLHKYWIDQVQWQMYLTKATFSYVAVWDWQMQQCILVEVKKDIDRQNEMREKAKEFWNRVRSGIKPEPTEKDYIEIEDPGLEFLVEEYKNLHDKEKGIKGRKKELKDQIIEFGDDGNFKAYGLKARRCQPRTAYDLKKMKEDGIDLEKYKKESNSIGFYVLTVD